METLGTAQIQNAKSANGNLVVVLKAAIWTAIIVHILPSVSNSFCIFWNTTMPVYITRFIGDRKLSYIDNMVRILSLFDKNSVRQNVEFLSLAL